MSKQEIRSVGDKTRKKIIMAARKLFAKNGYGETSIAKIAEVAGVNSSLIFHHFKNKEALWKAVKYTFVKDIEPINYDECENLKDFLTRVIYQRIHFFKTQPDCKRILLWQHLEPKQRHLVGGNPLSPDQWLKSIRLLQTKNEIKSELKPEFVLLLIAGLIESYINWGQDLLKTEDDQNQYLQLSIINLEKILRNK